MGRRIRGGLDFDEYGQIFITNCVIHHLWHMVPGAHTKRMFGQDPNPHSYGLLESCADHIHWAGGPWQSSRGGQGEHSVTGGGHAHAGAMVYLGDNWPRHVSQRSVHLQHSWQPRESRHFGAAWIELRGPIMARM